MKTVKKWTKDGHEVIIQAKFFKNGYYPSWVYNEEDKKDLIRFEAKIYDNSNKDDLKQVGNFESNAFEGRIVEVVKERWFRKDITRNLTLPEVYEEQLGELIEWCNEDIERRNFNKKITDGLPDSLLDLSN